MLPFVYFAINKEERDARIKQCFVSRKPTRMVWCSTSRPGLWHVIALKEFQSRGEVRELFDSMLSDVDFIPWRFDSWSQENDNTIICTKLCNGLGSGLWGMCCPLVGDIWRAITSWLVCWDDCSRSMNLWNWGTEAEKRSSYWGYTGSAVNDSNARLMLDWWLIVIHKGW